MNRLAFCLVLLLTACSGGNAAGLETDGAGGSPTASFYFSDVEWTPAPVTPAQPEEGTPPTPSAFFSTLAALPTRTPMPTRTPFPTLTPSPIAETPGVETPLPETTVTGLEDYTLVDIFTDSLTEGWTVDNSWDVNFDLEQATFTHSGEAAIMAAPEADFAALFLSVRPDAPTAYRYDETAGVRFWLSAGEEPIDLDQLAATILGSNEFPYFVEGDTSVETNPQEAFFSETRLYFFGFNRELPPFTWVEVVIWLDELPFDPEYTYITGLYIKNDVDFRATFYVDDVALITP